MKVNIKIDEQDLERQVKKAIDRKMRKAFTKGGEDLLTRYARVLRNTFANSTSYKDLKGRLVGEFGFTPTEVQNLDNILSLFVPSKSNPIVKIRTTDRRSSGFSMMLEWVDYPKLKDHNLAQHVLTRLDEDGNVVGITDVVSWVEWLEEGATIRGYTFTKPGGTHGGKNTKDRSRSGKGLMRKDGGIWTFQPTEILKNLAQGEDERFLKRGFGLLLERYAK